MRPVPTLALLALTSLASPPAAQAADGGAPVDAPVDGKRDDAGPTDDVPGPGACAEGAAVSEGDLITASSPQAGAGFGVELAPAGDVNRDGYRDLLVGEWRRSVGGAQRSGAVHLYLGAASGLAGTPVLLASPDPASNDELGAALASGDVNGDGFVDVVLGAAGATTGGVAGGKVHLFLGGPGGLAASASWSASFEPESGASFGISVLVADVDGDGVGDLVVGADRATAAGVLRAGRVVVFRGSAGGPLSAPIEVRCPEPEEDAGFGASLALLRGRDGGRWLAVGAPQATDEATRAGRVYVFRASALDGAPVALRPRVRELDGSFGFRLATGDVNGDGDDDLLVGADRAASGRGAAYLFLGRAVGPAASPGWQVTGDTAGAALGSAVAAGDLDGDGVAEILVGAPGSTRPRPEGPVLTGRVQAYRGAATIAARPYLAIDGPAPYGSFFGGSLALVTATATAPAWLAVGADQRAGIGGAVGGVFTFKSCGVFHAPDGGTDTGADGGSRDGPARDGAPGRPPAQEGCGCQVGAATRPPPLSPPLLVLAIWRRARRRSSAAGVSRRNAIASSASR